MTAEEIIAENERRRARLFAPYDPVVGAGSHVPRTPVPYLGGHPVWVPSAMAALPAVQMLAAAGSLEAFAASQNITPQRAAEHFNRLRWRYDFEFWAATCFMIEDKETRLVPLVLNLPQRISVAHREAMRFAGEPVRQVELKHRQYGSTTDKNAYLFWHQNVLHERWHAYIISLESGGAARIRLRYENAALHYPSGAGSVTFRGVRNAPSTQVIEERECRLSIAAATNPQAPSGDTTQGVLVSEAGKMRSGEVQDAGRLMTNIMSQVPMHPGTCVLIESTAEPTGAWFKRVYQSARAGKSNFKPLFISWTDDPQYTLPVPADVPAFIASWTQYEHKLFDKGATLEGIAWHLKKREDYDDIRQMQQEFPTDEEEAFQASEGRVFKPHLVAMQRKHVREPLMRGHLRADGVSGEAALSGIYFEPDLRGPLSVWRHPDELRRRVPEGMRLLRATCAGADVGPGLSSSANYSDCVVLDRTPRIYGGFPEVAAEWHGHLDPDLYAWECARLARWYLDAYLGIERNSYDFKVKDERTPEFGLTAIDEILPHYAHLYKRELAPDDTRAAPRYKAGWITTRETKGLMVKAYRKALRGAEQEAAGMAPEAGYVERSLYALEEADEFVFLPGGQMGHMPGPGKKDDRVIARAIACVLDQEMPPPELVPLVRADLRKPRGMAARI